ncbi:uncharacterized protein F4822DRAFT_308866 [Hypoxylon trugodes]|uniref:uncharacterized protein n=1 Tax=Hypoxylon trugodes TaxID=326681 RepID=UPI002195BCFA|nr:uncharacterized protein F4822DRAFT_308866 [Hypoxylon trugodes]KAI1386207.1 hypothetical protein F4822DRAFT_308866 [Hypoxylon trugodes]
MSERDGSPIGPGTGIPLTFSYFLRCCGLLLLFLFGFLQQKGGRENGPRGLGSKRIRAASFTEPGKCRPLFPFFPPSLCSALLLFIPRATLFFLYSFLTRSPISNDMEGQIQSYELQEEVSYAASPTSKRRTAIITTICSMSTPMGHRSLP